VPQSLANKGYTSDVVTQRLQIALNKILKPSHFLQVGSGADFKKVDAVPALQGQTPTITVPGTGLSFDAITTYIRAFFPNHWNVTGEITIAHSQLYLRLRMNGQDRYVSEQGVDPDRIDDLFSPAAQKMLALADPYRLAAYLANREPSKSLQLAQRIMKDRLETDNQLVAATQVLLGGFLLRQQRTDEALVKFHQVIELDPSAADAYIGFGSALNRQGKTDLANIAFHKAVAELRKASNSDPGSASAHANLGFALLNYEVGKTGEARAEFETAIDLDPADPDTHANLGIELVQIENNLEDGIAELRNAIGLDPSSALPHLMLGAALRAQDKTKEKEANDEFSTAFQLEPRNMSVHFLAAVLLGESKTKDAVEELRKGVDIDPDFAFAHIVLGAALDEAKKAEDALAEYRKAVKIDPNSAYAHKTLGLALKKAKKAEDAISEFRVAAKLEPRSTDALITLGQTLLDIGNTDDAVAEYHKVVEIDPSSTDAHMALGEALGAQDKTGDALAEYRKAVDLNQNPALAHRWLGGALLFHGKTEEALGELRTAIGLDPENAYGVIWLYLARIRSGAHDAAAELEANAKKLKPPDWPYQVVEIFRGRQKPKSTLAVPTKLDDRCDAQFYVGEWHLLHGGRPKALYLLKKAVATCPKTDAEYDFARAELKRLQ
jgi:tetratricopeptide (TPR) repeat protein